MISYFLQLISDENPNSTAGITLIEVLISISIIVVVTGFVFAQRGDFSRSVNLNNIAYETALIVRQAQSYGVSGLDDDIVGSADNIEGSSYGVLFDSSTPQEFTLYHNTNGNEGYQPGDEEIETYQLPSGMEIVYICVNNTASDVSCSSMEESSLVIMFSRPNPDAEFYTGSGSSISGETAVVVIQETDSGSTESIITRANGYITIE